MILIEQFRKTEITEEDYIAMTGEHDKGDRIFEMVKGLEEERRKNDN